MRVIAGVALAAALSGTVYAAPPRAWSPETRLTLARCLIAEADGHTADYLPILGVLERRAELTGRTIGQQARAYCGVYRLRTRRARAILASTVTRPAHGQRALWDRALDTVTRYERGLVVDTCGAAHWGGRGDTPPPRWVRVDCGPTANHFYVEGRRQPATSTPRPADAPPVLSCSGADSCAGRAVGGAR